MAERIVKVINRAGLHARPSAILAQAAQKFTSQIFFAKDNDQINGKSVMGLITLGASYGTELKISAQGDDEEAAVEALARLFETKFDEQ